MWNEQYEAELQKLLAQKGAHVGNEEDYQTIMTYAEQVRQGKLKLMSTVVNDYTHRGSMYTYVIPKEVIFTLEEVL